MSIVSAAADIIAFVMELLTAALTLYVGHLWLRARRRQVMLNQRPRVLQPGTRRFVSRPPRNAELLLWVFLPAKNRREMIGDLLEEFPEVVKHLGQTRANIWYWSQALRTSWAALGPAVKRLVGWSAAAAAAKRFLL